MFNFIAVLVPLIRDSNNPGRYKADPAARQDLNQLLIAKGEIIGITPAPSVDGFDAAVFYHLRIGL